jgi:hypothetical protein
MVKCGKDSCRCTRGYLHGPYFFRMYRLSGRLHKEYVSRDDVEAVRAACNLRRTLVGMSQQHQMAARTYSRVLLAELKEAEADVEDFLGNNRS